MSTEKINKKGLLGRSAGLIALSGALIGAAPAFSQSTTDQAATNGGDADQLQEVVVTAERRATDIMSTPISVVAVSGDQLQAAKIVDVESLGQVAPNLLVYNGGLSSSADIRGIGNSNQGGDEVPGVAIIRDGLPNPVTYGEGIPYFDIADVEVLRGPQGTFTGASSTGGAIDINSANPNFTGVNGYIDATAATYTEQRFQGAVNFPVSDTLALRFAFNEETRGSYFRDLATVLDGPLQAGPSIAASGQFSDSADAAEADPGNVDDKDLRVSVLWKPFDNFQNLTKIEFDLDDSNGVPTQPDTYSFTALKGQPCPAGDGTAPNCHNFYYPGYSGSPYTLNNWASNMLKANSDQAEYSNESRYTLPGGTVLRLLGGVQSIRADSLTSTSSDSLNVGSYTESLYKYYTYSGEFDVISPTTGPFSYIAGTAIYYNSWNFPDYAVNVLSPYSVAAPAIGAWIDGQVVKTTQKAAFGQVSWQFTPTLQVVGGLRMTWDSEFSNCDPTAVNTAYCYSNGHYELETYRPGLPPIFFTAGIDSTDRVLTGKVDLNWTPRPGQLFYGFVARGAKPGESNVGSEQPTHYEYVNDYEAGWKGKFVNGHMELQLDGYYQQYMDMIHSTFDPEIPGDTAEANIPFSILKGIEASFEGNVGHFSANINGAYNKSILGNFVTAARYKFPSGTNFGVTAQCAPGVAPSNSGTGCTDYTGSYPGDPSYIVNLSGEALPYAPTWTFYGSLQYAIPLGNTSLVPRVAYSYRSKTYSDIFQSDNYYLLPGYSLWSAYLDWEAGPWTTSIYGTNLNNSVYLVGTGLYGDPRQLGLEVKRTF
ncbi:MAG TPA: TonB-dependent receptor [Steroidobacteraceae bacterium]|nr:TonB-dependent receptor [Steroidobacteraceae bacterium]